MDSPKPGLDLERELTCSICTELLYRPLTVIDCLHTFCGACLKEWFHFQAETIETAPTPPTPQSTLFTCPSCRAAALDTRHNATIVSLLDMVVAANPDKARAASDKEEMDRKYTPGDPVMPKIQVRERTAEERRADAQDERLMQQVREMSLREAQGLPSRPPRTRRHRDSRSGDDRSRSSRDPSAEGRPRRTRDGGGGGHTRPRMDESGRASSDHLALESDRRRRRSESRQRQVEHQSSLRSLISSEDMSERDIEREIEEFARQIQEEGLLDGLDLDNIDLARNDELSRRITEAYRRRQRERPSRRSREDGHSSSSRMATATTTTTTTTTTHDPSLVVEARPSQTGESRRSTDGARPNTHSRSSSTSRQSDDRSRPPPSMAPSRGVVGRPRRRTGSGDRSSTLPNSPTTHLETDRAARSQTDLTLRTQGPDVNNPPRPPFGETRSASTPTSGLSQPPPQELVGSTPTSSSHASFANRLPHANPNAVSTPSTPLDAERLAVRAAHRPSDLAIIHNTVTAPHANPNGAHQPRVRSPLFPEPSIACARCGRAHIEYELHYNCGLCSSGEWNICRDCYRRGKGCQYWFGFGYGAWNKWERARRHDANLAMPHMLTACRYLPPPSTPGGADGRKTLTNDDPKRRLETGTFCAGCSAWTNDCYWRCDICNEGDWGFCNDCVNQGKSCSHMLLPLTHDAPPQVDGLTGERRPRTPRSPGRPPAATILTGPQASSIGSFKPLTFSTRCDICEIPIPPSDLRYHCYHCPSSLVPETSAGDYDICSGCYGKLVDQGRISAENGFQGWRRCLQGHRMVLIGFTDGQVGRWRYMDRDLVGGQSLEPEALRLPELDGQNLQKWGWERGDQRFARVVTKDVAATAPASHGSDHFSRDFPADGGFGNSGTAKWAWFPQDGVEDELSFPRGAEVKEIQDVNGDWFRGSYMGSRGLFPAPYVQTAGSDAGLGSR